MSKTTELTEPQITDILLQASSPDWQIPFFHGLPLSLTEVTKVSPGTGLIFIGGDENIGVKHIQNRHQGYVKQFKKKYSPTEFDFDISPIVYYQLADLIYKKGSCIERDYDHIYEADLSVAGSKHSKFRLVFYRDTKIVKTMYPVAEMEERPKYEIGFNAGYTHDVKQGKHVVEYKFYEKDNARFLLRVTYSSALKNEVREIFTLNKKGETGLAISTKAFPLNLNLDYLVFLNDAMKFPDECKLINEYIFTKA